MTDPAWPQATSSTLGSMRCPYCDAEDTRVLDSRSTDAGRGVRRRRQCTMCDQRFTTYERAASLTLVRKRDGRKEPFDLEKVHAGLERALGGRKLPAGAIEEILSKVEDAADTSGREISSEAIGHIVLEELKAIDDVAYLRFASVYKDFEAAGDFERELAALED